MISPTKLSYHLFHSKDNFPFKECKGVLSMILHGYNFMNMMYTKRSHELNAIALHSGYLFQIG